MLKQRVPLLSVLLVALVLGVGAWAARNSGGTYSLPSGNPVITGTTITSTWANATLNDIKTEITSSLDRSGRGGMLAPLSLTSGTSAAPGMTWGAEPSSGLYRSSAGDERMSVLTVPVMGWTSALISSLVPLTVTGRTTTTNLTVTGTSDTLTCTALAVGTAGLWANGNGSGNGVNAQGGSGLSAIGINAFGGTPNGPGVSATAVGTGAGVLAIGGSSAGPGLQATGGTGGNGVTATGSGSGVGIQGTGGATSGRGIYGLGGAPNGVGIYGISQGTGSGVYGSAGASGGAGVEGANAVPATGAVRQDAIRAGSGDINLDGTANATSTTAMKNRLAPNNITKAWGAFVIGAAGAVTMTSGFNITSVASSGSACGGATQVDVNFASGFSSSTSYAVVVGSADTSIICNIGARVVAQTAGQVSIKFLATAFDATPSFGINNCQQVACGAGSAATSNWNGMKFTLIAIGAQ